jgi:hypothetical protein
MVVRLLGCQVVEVQMSEIEESTQQPNNHPSVIVVGLLGC